MHRYRWVQDAVVRYWTEHAPPGRWQATSGSRSSMKSYRPAFLDDRVIAGVVHDASRVPGRSSATMIQRSETGACQGW
jgi:hypothetical protein